MKKPGCIFVLAFLFLTACLPVEEPVLPPPILEAAESASYRTQPVYRGDVILYRDINAVYVPAREEALSFGMNDVLIRNVFVEIGDYVNEGDAVAELDRDYFLRELERIERDETWTTLHLKQLEERYQFDLMQADATGVPFDSSAYLEQRESYLSQLENIRITREYLLYESERRVMRSPMDGVVTYTINFKEGDRTTADQRIVTVADQSQSVFEVRGLDAAYVFEGEFHEMTIRRERYVGEVVNPDEVGISRGGGGGVEYKYIVVREGDQSGFTSRDYATITIILDSSENTLYVPHIAVKRANARIFSYVFADGIRSVRDIEIGLEGNSAVEVLGGLEAGELVILD